MAEGDQSNGKHLYADLARSIACLIIFCGLGGAMIAVGAVYMDQCTIQSFIPLYLLVQGVIFLILGTLLAVFLMKPKMLILAALMMLNIFWFCWFISGSVWVFQRYTTYPGQCHRTLYLFAFWTLITHFIGCAIVLSGVLVYCCYFCMLLLACQAVNG